MEWYEVEYREQPEEVDESEAAWVQMTRIPIDSIDVQIPDLQIGRPYEVRMRTFDDDTELRSPWVLRRGIMVESPQQIIPSVDDVRVASSGCLEWAFAEEAASVIGFEIAHGPGALPHPGLLEQAHEGVVASSPFPLCGVPGGLRTISIVAVDEYGNRSEPTMGEVYVRELDDQSEFTTEFRDHKLLGWPDQIIGGTIVGDEIHADLTPDPDGDLAPFWTGDANPFWTGDANPFWTDTGPGRFWESVDPVLTLPEDARPYWRDDINPFWTQPYEDLRYIADVTVPQISPSQRITVSAEVNAENNPLRIRYATPSQPSLFKPWPGHIVPTELGVYKIRLEVDGGVKRGDIIGFTTRISSEATVERVTNFAVSDAGDQVPVTAPFNVIENVTVTLVNGTLPGSTVIVMNKDPSGPMLQANPGGAAVCDVEMRGY